MRDVVLATAALITAASMAAARAEPARLAGVVVADGARTAVFADRAGGPWLVLHEGDRLGEERVGAIAAGSVRLDGPNGSRILSLQDDPAGRAARLAVVPPLGPHVDAYRRERDVENDQ